MDEGIKNIKLHSHHIAVCYRTKASEYISMDDHTFAVTPDGVITIHKGANLRLMTSIHRVDFIDCSDLIRNTNTKNQ